MDIVNKIYIQQLFKQHEKIFRHLPKSDAIETIPIADSLGRKLAEDVYAKKEYPDVALAALDGEMINLKEDLSDEKKLDNFPNLLFTATLGSGVNPYRVNRINEYIASISKFMKVGNIANAVIPLDDYLAYVTKKTALNKNKNIKIGTGLISTGSDYKVGDLILKKNDFINLPKKMLLKQANIEEVMVYYKSKKIALLCVDYDLVDLNSRFEFEYIQECVKSWGFSFDILKVKPFRRGNAVIPNEDANLTVSLEKYDIDIEEIIKEYDFTISCGLDFNRILSQVGLNARFGSNTIDEQNNIPIKNQSIGSSYYFVKGRQPRSPIKRVNVTYNNEKGFPYYNTQYVYEDNGVLFYTPGYILDMIVNMHMITKPALLSYLNNKPMQPEWKFGVLTHDCDVLVEEGHSKKILWAYVTDVVYDRYQEYKIKYAPEIKIITVEDERPDMLSFMKDCNCFVPITVGCTQLKAGDYLYYLEI